jgi:large subunit ribosomal protein L25
MITLKAEIRDTKEKNDALRKAGFIPSVFYGPKETATSIKIKQGDFLKAYEQAGESSIINLQDGKNEHEALIQDVQFDAVSGLPIHADFYVIEKGKKVEVRVPIHFVGNSPAEKQMGGILVKVMHELHIQALPKDLPAFVEANIDSLVDFTSQLKASDIKLGSGVELLVSPEEIVALVQEYKEEVEAAPIDLSAIEVEEKGKKEPEEGAPAEGAPEAK